MIGEELPKTRPESQSQASTAAPGSRTGRPVPSGGPPHAASRRMVSVQQPGILGYRRRTRELIRVRLAALPLPSAG
jgi:hypothetical protein